jgi:hypothetical protein
VELISNRRKRTILSDYKRHIPGATAFTIREGSAEFTAAISNYALGKDPGGVDAFIHELDRGLDRAIALTLTTPGFDSCAQNAPVGAARLFSGASTGILARRRPMGVMVTRT